MSVWYRRRYGRLTRPAVCNGGPDGEREDSPKRRKHVTREPQACRPHAYSPRRAPLAPSAWAIGCPGRRCQRMVDEGLTEVLPGEVVRRHACKIGLEGIVSKRLGSRYRSGRSPDWLKMKILKAGGGEAGAEEDWGKEK